MSEKSNRIGLLSLVLPRQLRWPRRKRPLALPRTSEMRHIPLQSGVIWGMSVELRGGGGMDEAVDEITALLHRRHASFSPSGDDFQVQNRKSLIDAQLAAFSRLSFLVSWIAVSTLAVSAFGIWGICWIGVRNRTREIGARRAIGATRADLLVQFLCETMIAALLGCALGIVAAFGGVRMLDAAVSQPFMFSWTAALLNVSGAATLFAAFVAFASGRAASLDPIAALRSE